MPGDWEGVCFDPQVDTVLRKFGWTPDRRVPVEHWVESLTADGYTVHDAALPFLRNLGGLRVEPPNGGDAIVFDPLWAHGEFDRIAAWQAQHGLVLFPVGQVLAYYMLFVAADGSVYVGMDEDLYVLGGNMNQALYKLIFERGGEPEQAPIPPGTP
jgi:hypothetical protein